MIKMRYDEQSQMLSIRHFPGEIPNRDLQSDEELGDNSNPLEEVEYIAEDEAIQQNKFVEIAYGHRRISKHWSHIKVDLKKNQHS